MQIEKKEYGSGSASFEAAGEFSGIEKLVDAFYRYMSFLPEASTIRKMYPDELSESRRKLVYFLSGWLGGPRLYQEHYGQISIPKYHKKFSIDNNAKKTWLLCMQKAIEEQPYQVSFKSYLLAQLEIPAERIRHVRWYKNLTRLGR